MKRSARKAARLRDLWMDALAAEMPSLDDDTISLSAMLRYVYPEELIWREPAPSRWKVVQRRSLYWNVSVCGY